MQHQRLKQQQTMMQQALLHQQSVYHPALLAPPHQIEPYPSGNLPPGFDPSSCRSVYVGNIQTQVTEPLLQEVFAATGPVESCKLIRKEKVSQVDLHRHFHALGVGAIEEVRVQRDKGFGFVRYNTHADAALAIQMGNTQASFLSGRQIKCSWGSKPTPPGTASNPLPPPAPTLYPGLSAVDILAYERQLAMAKMGGGVQALMQAQAQHPFKQASMSMGGSTGANQAIYDGGFQNLAAAQQLMYYQ